MKGPVYPTSFQTTSKDISVVFSNAGRKLEKLIVDTRNVRGSQTRNINLQCTSPKELLNRFLSELVYIKDTYQLVFSKIDVIVNEEANSLTGYLKGERFDKVRHKQRSKIVALTQRMMKIEKIGENWQVQVNLGPENTSR